MTSFTPLWRKAIVANALCLRPTFRSVVIFVKYREVSTRTILPNFIDLFTETALYSRFRGVGERGREESVRRASSGLLRFGSGRSGRGPLAGAPSRRLAVFPTIRRPCTDFLTKPSVCLSVPTPWYNLKNSGGQECT